jgi:hypothetical protein
MSEPIPLLPLYGFLGRTGTTFPASLDIRTVLEGREKLRGKKLKRYNFK